MYMDVDGCIWMDMDRWYLVQVWLRVRSLAPRKAGLGAPPYGDYVRTSWKNDFFSLRALKLLAIHEKQLLTFFGFLPPYFDVSRSLA